MADNWGLKAVLSAVDKMSPVLKTVSLAAKNTRKYVSDVASSASALGSKIGVPFALGSAAAAALSIGGMQNAIMSFAALGDQVHKSAQRIGVSTDEYQKFNYMAGQSGVSAEELGSSMGRLNKGIAAAASGKGKELAGLLKHVGISMRDSNGNLRSATDLLPEVAELFKNNTNAATQAKIGNAIFGKSWQSLAPLLQGGKEGIAELTARYGELGIAVSEDAILAGEKFGDQMDDLGMVTRSFGNTIAARVIPRLSPMIEKMISWGTANRDLIATKIADYASQIADAVEKIDWDGIVQGVISFVSGAKSFVDSVGGMKTVLIGLAVVMNAGTIMATYSFISAILKLAWFLGGPLLGAIKSVWVALAANPFVAIALAAAMLGGMIYANWDGIVGYISSAWERIKSVFEVNFFDGIIQIWLESFQGLLNGIVGIVNKIVSILPESMIPDAFKGGGFTFATDRANALAGGAGADGANGANGSLVGGAGVPITRAQETKSSAKFEVDFKGAPAGMQVKQVSNSGNAEVDASVGYRSAALGAA